MLPSFIGIGAPRAGTTWLFRCLREHPEVFMAEVKEAVGAGIFTPNFEKELELYRQWFELTGKA